MPFEPQFLDAVSRRRFLKAAGLLATLPVLISAKSNTRVTIAGAGIVGASIGYALARAGAAVTLIDEREPAALSSLATFAWINASWAKQPRHYHHLSQLGVALWHELEAELSIPVRWHGSIEWFESSERQENSRLISKNKSSGASRPACFSVARWTRIARPSTLKGQTSRLLAE